MLYAKSLLFLVEFYEPLNLTFCSGCIDLRDLLKAGTIIKEEEES